MNAIRLTSLTVLALALWGCGSATQGTTSGSASTVAVAQTATRAATVVRHHSHPGPTLTVSSTPYGRALTDSRGFALYLFTHDRAARSACYGACAAAWPPYRVSSRPSAVSRGGRAALLGSARRRDGSLQVTYAGHPLYHYVGDKRPGQVLCQAVPEFGGTWYVVAPDGHVIR